MASHLLFAIAGVQIPLHFLAYVAFKKQSPPLQTERGILAFHVLSFALATVLVTAGSILTASGSSLAWAAAVLAVHGIYSLTFLELWTLSQISYSREILLRVREGVFKDANEAPPDLVAIGDQKRSGRLHSLEALGLIRQSNGGVNLTSAGKCVSALLRLLQYLPNMRETG